MKKLILIIIISAISLFAFSQQTLFSLATKDFSRKGDFGPNLKHYVQFSVIIGPIFNDGSPSLKLQKGNASFVESNIRYKRRLNNYFATGFDIFLSARSYELEQYAGKAIPDTNTYLTEYLNSSDLGTAIYLRLNLNKRRGNYLGDFIDLGIAGSYVVRFSQNTTLKNGNKKISTTTKGFDFYERYFYSAYFRLGFQKQGFIFKYRLSPLFKNSFGIPDLPPMSIGYEISF